MWSLLLVACFAIFHADCQPEAPAWPQHDGKRRVLSLNADNFQAAVKKHPLLVVLFYVPSGHPADPLKDKEVSRQNWQQLEMALEMTAQLLQRENVRTATINMIENMGLVKALRKEQFDYSLTSLVHRPSVRAERSEIPSPGSILIYSKDQPTPQLYLGHRAVEVLAPYLLKMLQPAVTEIIGKTQKKQYDQLDTPKVIGYFEKDSKEYENFVKAAESFQPLVPFFATFDKKLAKSFRAKKPNSVVFDKPHEKYLVLSSPKTSEEITGFVQGNMKQILTKLQLENIHGTWTHSEDQKMLVAFVRPQTSDGATFFSVLKSLARSYADDKRTYFIWVDPDPLPNLHGTWKKLYNIDVAQSHAFFGVVDGHKGEHAWYDVRNEGADFKKMRSWVERLLSSQIELNPVRTAGKVPLSPSPDSDMSHSESSHSSGDL